MDINEKNIVDCGYKINFVTANFLSKGILLDGKYIPYTVKILFITANIVLIDERRYNVVKYRKEICLMNDDILNLEQAMELLGVSEKTLIKMLREEHVPARKIGREWRFSREALIKWIASGDSINYINQNEVYMVSKDTAGESSVLFDKVEEAIADIKKKDNNIKVILKDIDKDVKIPQNASLRISYKQQREVEKLEFKIFWGLREE